MTSNKEIIYRREDGIITVTTVRPVPEVERREVPTHDLNGRPMSEKEREYENYMLNYEETTVVKNIPCSACHSTHEIICTGPPGLSDFNWEDSVFCCKKLQLCESCLELIAPPSEQESTSLTAPAAAIEGKK
jgi:hypothetical protein